jgi:hypothetical protein
MVDHNCPSHKTPPEALTLDIDDTVVLSASIGSFRYSTPITTSAAAC